MSVGSVSISLHASHKDGRAVTTAEFLAPLNLQPGEVDSTQVDGGPWTSGIVSFAVVHFSAFAHIDTAIDAGARSEAFFAGLGEAFRAVGKLLDRRSPDITTAMRSAGLSLRLFIDVRMDQDQMELELPPALLAACGRHGLGVYLLSNDISAAELLAMRRGRS